MMADQSICFFADYMIDHEDGGGYATVRPNGDTLDSHKGDAFKAEYHSVELFYYAYLYGNLLYHRKPVTLYYQIPPSDEEQVVKLTPIAIEDERLIITDVALDGTDYFNFNGATREITLDANQGGELQVTFARID